MTAIRITRGVTRTETVRFTFDGKTVEGSRGESLATALAAAGILHLRNAPGDGGERGMFCAMGVCQECVLLIDGQRRESCRTSVAEGLEVRRISYE